MTTIEDNLHAVQRRIRAACEASARPLDGVRLLAVSKTFGADAVRAASAAGQRAFGENYIQEGVEKIQALADLGLQWHCIGPVQSNKTRLVAQHFDWVHTVDRDKVAQRLNDQRPAHLPPLQVCLQVNVDGGATKSGVAPQALWVLAQAVAGLPRLRLRGLMCIPEPATEFVAQCEVFMRAKALFDQMAERFEGIDTLSMGMSADLEAAIHSGSTLVRVGSAIFGARHYPASAPG